MVEILVFAVLVIALATGINLWSGNSPEEPDPVVISDETLKELAEIDNDAVVRSYVRKRERERRRRQIERGQLREENGLRT